MLTNAIEEPDGNVWNYPMGYMMKKLKHLFLSITTTAASCPRAKYCGKMVLPTEIPLVVLNRYADYKPGKQSGNVEYDYYLKNGSRVKNGQFKFKFTGTISGIYEVGIYGTYKDDVLNGKWLFTNSSFKLFASFTYLNGERTGEFEARIVINEPYIYRIKGSLKNNFPIGAMTVDIATTFSDKYDFAIKTGFDDNGYLDGKTTLAYKNGRYKQTRTYLRGVLNNVCEYDDSTGENTELYSKTIIPLSSIGISKYEQTVRGKHARAVIGDTDYNHQPIPIDFEERTDRLSFDAEEFIELLFKALDNLGIYMPQSTQQAKCSDAIANNTLICRNGSTSELD